MKTLKYVCTIMIIAAFASNAKAEIFEVPEDVTLKPVSCAFDYGMYRYRLNTDTNLFLGEASYAYLDKCNAEAIKTNRLISQNKKKIKLDVVSGRLMSVSENGDKESTSLVLPNQKLKCEYAKNVAKTVINESCNKPTSLSLVSCTDEIGIKFTSLAVCQENTDATKCYDEHSKTEAKTDKENTHGAVR